MSENPPHIWAVTAVRKALAALLPAGLSWRKVDTDPDPGRYAVRENFEPGQDVPIVIDGVELGRIAVADLLP